MAHILIVDDEQDIVEYLGEKLERIGHKVDTASDGVEAVLQVIPDHSIDAILMDIRMPRLDGIEALRIIKEHSPHIPVIMFTGQAGVGDMATSVQLGAYTCMTKPVSTDKLFETLKIILPNKA